MCDWKEKYEKLKEKLEEIASILPLEHFVTEDVDGAVYVDWEQIDAADFKDHSGDFAKAMVKTKVLQKELS